MGEEGYALISGYSSKNKNVQKTAYIFSKDSIINEVTFSSSK